MLGVIFGVFFVVLLLFGFSMVAAYGAAFIIPSLMTGGSLYQMSDIVGWLTSAAGKSVPWYCQSSLSTVMTACSSHV